MVALSAQSMQFVRCGTTRRNRKSLPRCPLQLLVTFVGAYLFWKYRRNARLLSQRVESKYADGSPTLPGGCSWYNDYVRFHKDTVQKLRDGSTDVKLLVYDCHNSTGFCGGLGDRFSGIASLFYASVVLKRAFVIDQTKPTPLDQILIPKVDINWNVADLLPSLPLNSSTVGLIDAYTVTAISNLFLPLHADANVLRVSMNRYYTGKALWHYGGERFPWFFGAMNRAHSDNCPTIANDGDTFALAFSILFQPSQPVTNRISEMERTLGLRHFGGSLKRFMAIHARVGGVIDSSMGVAGWEDPIRPTFATINDATEVVNCAHARRSKFLGEEISREDGVLPIVVFSNDQEFKRESIRLDPNLMYLNDTLTFHVDKSTGDPDTVSKGNIDAVAEYYLLARATCIIGSLSTFSGSAASLMHARIGSSCYFYFRDCDRLIPDFWSLTEPPFLVE